MARYTKELKNSMIVRMAPPHNEPVSELCKETGIRIETLSKWKHLTVSENRPASHKNLIQPAVVELRRKLKQTERDNKYLERMLRKKEADLARAESLLALQAKPNAIWGLGDD